MITAIIHHPEPGETNSFTTVMGLMGQMQINCAETGDRGGAIIVNREEAWLWQRLLQSLPRTLKAPRKLHG